VHPYLTTHFTLEKQAGKQEQREEAPEGMAGELMCFMWGLDLWNKLGVWNELGVSLGVMCGRSNRGSEGLIHRPRVESFGYSW
jgi:hypothetical protein